MPFTLLLALTSVCIAITSIASYWRTRDALHPAVFIGPMLFYQFVYRPWLLFEDGKLQEFFQNPAHLEYGAFIHLIGIAGFCLGVLPKRFSAHELSSGRYVLTPEGQRALVRLAVILAIVASIAYYWQVFAQGGFLSVYSKPKAYLAFQSGYFAEATGLAIPAAILLIWAWRSERWTVWRWLAVISAVSPVLLHGLLGARRGPTFLVLGGLAFAWFFFRKRHPRILTVFLSTAAICFVVIFLFVNRPRIYIGSPEPPRVADVVTYVSKPEAGPGDDYVVATAKITMAHHIGRYGWGRNFLILFFVRPIPKQWWPTKYIDAQRFLYGRSESGQGVSYQELLGWEPAAGSATGAFADLYCEFSFFVVLAAYVYGSI